MLLSIFLLVVVVATLTGSISGIGGGVLIKPVMDAFFPFSSSQISFLSGTTVLTMTIVSLLRSHKELRMDLRTLMLALGGALGGVWGKWLFESVKRAAGNDSAVGLVQNIIMIILTTSVFFYTLKKESIKTKDYKSPLFALIIGVLLGLLSSFLGIGGGPLNIMVLSYLFSLSSKEAALSSLFVIFFSQLFSFVTTLVTKTIPDFDYTMLVLMIVSAVIGSMVGRGISKKIDSKKVDILFMALMVIIIALSIFNTIKFGMAL